MTEPPLDRGLLLGDALFETILLRHGRPFRLSRHLERLRDGADRVGIPVPAGLDERVAAELASPGGRGGRTGEPEWAGLRITLTRGPGDGLAPPPHPRPGLYLRVRTVERQAPGARRGLRAIRAGRIADGGLASGLKSTNYLERILALRAARAAGADEALLVSSTGRVVEGTASNLFLVHDGVLGTPSVAEGALPGITREAILELARSQGISVRIGDVADPERADELFLTSSLRGPIALVRLDGRAVGGDAAPGGRDPRPGPVFTKLARALEACIARETVAREMGSDPNP